MRKKSLHLSSGGASINMAMSFLSPPTGLRKNTGNVFSVELAPPPSFPLRLPGHRASFEYLKLPPHHYPFVMCVGHGALQVHGGTWNAITDVQKSECSKRQSRRKYERQKIERMCGSCRFDLIWSLCFSVCQVPFGLFAFRRFRFLDFFCLVLFF